jgi:hypothetical protein
MLQTHESGHLLGGRLSGATLKDYDLRPWRLPYSIHDPNPHPLITLWCGPIVGVLVPVVVALLIRRRWAWFIADFCILANGAYLAASWLSSDKYLDTTQLLHNGAHPITIMFFCAATIPIGYVRFRRDCLSIFDIQSGKPPSIQANANKEGEVASVPRHSQP